jgi:hypothetical protein
MLLCPLSHILLYITFYNTMFVEVKVAYFKFVTGGVLHEGAQGEI